MEENPSPPRMSLEEKLQFIVFGGVRPEGDGFVSVSGVVYSSRRDWLELHEAREPHDD